MQLGNKAGNLFVIYLDELSIYHEPNRERGAFSRIDYEQFLFFLRDSRASETRACVKIIPRKKEETRWGERKMKNLFSNRRVSPFPRGVIFTRARVSLTLLSLRKNGDYS